MAVFHARRRASTAFLPVAVLACLVALAVVNRESAIPLGRSALPLTRDFHNLFCWTQRKTGSTSATIFFRELSRRAYLAYEYTGRYVYTEPREPVTLIGSKNCTVFSGHLRIPAVHLRAHEAERTAIITTNRDVKHFMISKYFFKLKRFFSGDLKHMNDTASSQALIWWFVWESYDPCETLRYYDGLPGCNLDTFRERAEAIASRIDCVIDTEDAQPDADAICKAMKLDDCPQFVQSKTRVKDVDAYQALLDIPHVRESLRVIEGHLQVFRDVLMKRLCRNVLKAGLQVETRGWTPAKWPTRQCRK